jgi:hypothetical protein
MPRFAVVALSLAMQCGLSQRTLNDMLYFVGELRDGTMDMDGVLYDWSRRFDPSAKVARPADRPAERPGLEEVGGIRAVAAYDQINLIRRSAKSLSERFGRKLRLADMTEAWPEAVRFSFNRPV